MKTLAWNSGFLESSQFFQPPYLSSNVPHNQPLLPCKLTYDYFPVTCLFTHSLPCLYPRGAQYWAPMLNSCSLFLTTLNKHPVPTLHRTHCHQIKTTRILRPHTIQTRSTSSILNTMHLPTTISLPICSDPQYLMNIYRQPILMLSHIYTFLHTYTNLIIHHPCIPVPTLSPTTPISLHLTHTPYILHPSHILFYLCICILSASPETNMTKNIL